MRRSLISLIVILSLCATPHMLHAKYDSFYGIGTTYYNGLTWRYRVLGNTDSDTTPARVGAGQSTSKSDWRAISKNTTGEIEIPSQLDGRTIIGLYDYAFQDCAGITSVVVPSSVTSLGAKSFMGCSSLTNVYIPNSVTKIVCYVLSGNGFCYTAFPDCSNIKNVTIPPRFEFASIFPACYTSIEKVSMPGGESSICNNAFSGCSGIKEVNIASDVTAIGSCAFKNCTSLSSIVLPEGLLTIGNEAISGCSGLTEITIPDSVTTISDGALGGCANLKKIAIAPKFELSKILSADCNRITNVVLSANYDYIGASELANCTGLTSFQIPDNIVSIKDNAFYGCSGISDIKIPDTVESLGTGAFMGCSGLTNVIVSTSIDILPKNLFKSCTGLERIKIPEGVTEISEGAFDACSQLKKVDLPSTLTKIGANAFRNCTGIAELTIPDSVIEISPSAFVGCSAVTKIVLPPRWKVLDILPSCYKTVKSVTFTDCDKSIIGEALLGCSAVTSVFIPNVVTNIGSSTFRDCSTLENISMPQDLQKIGIGAFEGCSKLKEITIPVGVTTVPSGCFRNCTNMTEVALPQGLQSINAEAFKNCISLSSLTIPDSVSAIALSAFAGCENVKCVRLRACFVMAEVLPDSYDTVECVEYPEGTVAISTNALEGCANLMSMAIPVSVTTIGAGAFRMCEKLASIEIPNGITNLPAEVFAGCTNLKSIALSPALMCIGESAFADCSSLTEVAFPESLVILESGAFMGCKSLRQVDIPGTVKKIGNSAFKDCTSLDVITIGEGVESIGFDAFAGCTDVETLNLASTLTNFGNADFKTIKPNWQPNSGRFWIEAGWVLAYADDTVVSFQIPDGVKGIAPFAFADFENLESVAFPSALKYIGYGAFKNDAGLDNVCMPDLVECIDAEAFMNCTYLRNLQMCDELKRIGDRAFYHCSQLTSISIPDGVTEIGSQAFFYCWRMLSVKLPLCLETVGTNLFESCSSLVGISAPASRFAIKDLMPDHLSKLTSVSVLDGEHCICSNAFANCTALLEITLPNSITNIGEATFLNCSKLTDVSIPAGVTALGNRVFSGCSSLKGIVLPDSITTMGSYAFNNCTALSSVTLSRSLEALADYAFWNCPKLTSTVLPASVKSLGKYIGNAFTALYFLGNAPKYDSDVYAAMPSAMKTYIVQGTRGWDGIASSRDIPQLWNARAITTWEPIRFDATFDAVGGTFPDDSTTYACEEVTDTSYVFPPFDPVRPGYKFAGWWTDASEGAQIKHLMKVNETRATTYYAHWTFSSIPMTVRFHANGGTVSPEEKIYFVGATYESFPVPTKEHYIFGGWYTSAESGVKVAVSDEVPQADQELFAHWTPETYSIHYNANGGSGYMANQSFTYGSSVTLQANAFSKSGCNFIGWGLSADGPVAYANNKTISSLTAIQNGEVNLYAIWSTATYAVRFDSNGGIGSMTNDTFTFGFAQPLTTNCFSREGYVFIGWSTTVDGAVAYKDGSVVQDLVGVADGATTLYATWARQTSNVALKFGGNVPWSAATFSVGGAVVWQSGDIKDSQISWVEAQVSGTGTLSFDWLASCEPSFRGMRLDYVRFCIDGVEQEYLNGLTEWQTQSYTIAVQGNHTLRWEYVKDSEGSDNDDCAQLMNIVWVPNLQTLAEFVNVTNLTLETSGDAPWSGETTVAYDGVAAICSGEISDGQRSTVTAAFKGAGTISFMWKVSCEEPFRRIPLDYLSFVVDDKELIWISGETDWTNICLRIEGKGDHVISWCYQKDDWENTSAGDDCAWLDVVNWIPDAVVDEPIPNIGDNPSQAEISHALKDSADARLAECITNAANYNAYRDWATNVKTADGGDKAGAQAVKESSNAWFSFAVGSDKLISELPTSEDVKVDEFIPSSESGKFDFTVSIEGVTVGEEALKENLKQVFGLEGSTSLDPDGFSSNNVEIDFDTPENGKVKFTAGPKSGSANTGTFFMKVKVNP